MAVTSAPVTGRAGPGSADRIVLRGGRIVARTLTATEIARPELHVMRSAWNLPRAPSAGDWRAARHPDR